MIEAPHAVTAARPVSQSLPLNGTWKLGAVPQQPYTFRENDRHAVERWWDMTLPGGIHSALMQAGALPNMYQYENIRRAEWVNERDWWLQRDFVVRRDEGERLFLNLDCVDYIATLWLNDTLLTRHEGAFSRWTVEITDHVPPDGVDHTYQLGLRLTGANAFPEPAWTFRERMLIKPTRMIHKGTAAIYPYHPRLRLLRPPMQAGWDFAPTLPVLGVWEDITLERTNDVRLCHVALGKWHWAADDHLAQTMCTLIIDAAEATTTTVCLEWSPANFAGDGGTYTHTISVPQGVSRHHLRLTIPQPRRWQPWEQGLPNLYYLNATVDDSHQIRTHFGIRSVTWEHYRLTVNEQPFFARGVNWVPLDTLGATSHHDHDRYRALLTYARDQNVNFLRVWGGGARERKVFYELCDELGLLVWQEFPFACAFLDHYPRDEEFLSLAEQEATGIVRALEPHPSIAVWCAGNEFSAQRNRPLISRLAGVVSREDDRPFLPPSPTGVDHHQWQVWHGYAPLHYLDEQDAMFLSEVGLQALPDKPTLSKIMEAEHHFPPNPAWEEARGEIAKLQAYLPVEARNNLDTFIAASQSAQAWGLQLAIERMRRRKKDGAGGVALWQWNEPYPVISWAIVDYFGNPKVAAEHLKEWYSPVAIMLAFDRKKAYKAGDSLVVTVWAINDLAHTLHDCTVDIRQGETLLFSMMTDIPPHSAQPIKEVTLALPGSNLLELDLYHQDKPIHHNTYPLLLPPPHESPRFAKLYRTVASWILEK